VKTRFDSHDETSVQILPIFSPRGVRNRLYDGLFGFGMSADAIITFGDAQEVSRVRKA